MKRRCTMTLLALSLALTTLGSANAQSPTITLVVGYPAGGSADAIARLLADKLKPELGANIIVDNRAGAGGQIAAEAVKRSAADGSTVLLANTHMMVTLPLTSKSARYDPLKDFTPLGRVVSYHAGIALAGNVPATHLGQWLDIARSDVKHQNYGVPAPGSIPQFIGYKIGVEKKIPLLSVPYKGGAPLVQDLLGGQLSAAIVGTSRNRP